MEGRKGEGKGRRGEGKGRLTVLQCSSIRVSRFFQISKKHDFLRFLSWLTRFLEHCCAV